MAGKAATSRSSGGPQPCKRRFSHRKIDASLKVVPTIIAISDWEGRVSPVFDVAGRLFVVHIAADHSTVRRHERLSEQTPLDRARQLAGWQINVLLCGGISGGLRALLEQAGVTVIPHVCGGVEDVLQAYMENQLSDNRFVMPGCCGRRPRCRRT